MAELDYKNLKSHLDALKMEEPAPVYLFYGEEFLYKTALEEFLDAVFTSAEKRLNYDVIDDNNENIQEVIDRINTYPLLAGPRVVAFRDSKIFHSGLDVSDFIEKARAAHDADDIRKASEYIRSLMSRLQLTYADVDDSAARRQRLKYDPGVFGEDVWLEKIIGYCKDNNQPIPLAADNADRLQRAIEKGFPRGSHLVITTDMVDKRRALYKCILKTGAVVDCSVPRGDRQADKTAQAAVLNEQLQSVLARSGKSITREAADRLAEMTGFDLRTFSSNLEKLVDYAGNRTEISADDVETVLHRTKKDPLYELTNSVAERNALNAIFFMDSLLADNFHPLQILAALTNQVRKLLLIRDFMESPHGSSWQGPPTSFPRFRDTVLPAMQAYDRDILNLLADWDKLTVAAGSSEAGKPSAKKDRGKTDLAIVKNPQNPYPVFHLARNAQGFDLHELQAALEALSRADLQMKSTSKNNRFILENVIFMICGRTEK